MLNRFRLAIPLLAAALALPGVVHAAPTVYVISGKLNETLPGLTNTSVHGNVIFESGTSTAIRHIAIVVGGLNFSGIAAQHNYSGTNYLFLTTPQALNDELVLCFNPSAPDHKGFVELLTHTSAGFGWSQGSALITQH